MSYKVRLGQSLKNMMQSEFQDRLGHQKSIFTNDKSIFRDLVALLNLSSWCLVMVKRLFLADPWGCLGFVIVVYPDHTHLLFLQMTTV